MKKIVSKERLAIELKKGQEFIIKGKRKKYLVEDIFPDYFSVTIYFRVSGGNFSKIKLSKTDLVILT